MNTRPISVPCVTVVAANYLEREALLGGPRIPEHAPLLIQAKHVEIGTVETAQPMGGMRLERQTPRDNFNHMDHEERRRQYQRNSPATSRRTRVTAFCSLQLSRSRFYKIKIVAIPKDENTFLLAVENRSGVFLKLRDRNLNPLLQGPVQAICRTSGPILPS